MLKLRGFTLIEIMITVAIIAILAAVGYPSYTDYVRRGRITEAIATLSNQRVSLERWFQDNRAYDGAGNPCAAIAPSKSFNFDCPTLTATTYSIRAQGMDSMTGFTYTLDQNNGKKTTALPAGWNGVNNACCVLRKDGSC